MYGFVEKYKVFHNLRLLFSFLGVDTEGVCDGYGMVIVIVTVTVVPMEMVLVMVTGW